MEPDKIISLGIKTDPIETRYSFNWLFDLSKEEGIKYIQLGSFFELYSLDDDYFIELKEIAEQRGLIIKSLFTAHRELGGFFYDNRHMEKVARQNFERFIHVAGLLGADYCGSNPGAVYRDQMFRKDKGIRCYLNHMKELMCLAKEKGLKGLTMEVMSSLAEPPTLPQEIDRMVEELNAYYYLNKDACVPVYLCGDISHGLADRDRQIIYSNTQLFEYGIPYMAEFHFKNTDTIFNSTFGFSLREKSNGIVDLDEIKILLKKNRQKIPVKDLVGYLEIGGPKTGRDYSDQLLENALRESLRELKHIFDY